MKFSFSIKHVHHNHTMIEASSDLPCTELVWSDVTSLLIYSSSKVSGSEAETEEEVCPPDSDPDRPSAGGGDGRVHSQPGDAALQPREGD